MADPQAVQLPTGYADAKPALQLPAGYEDAQPGGGSTLAKVGGAALNFGKGVLEGAGQTGNSIVHATDYVGNKIGDVIGLPGHASAQDIVGGAPAGTGVNAMNQLTTPTTTAEKVGVGAESIAEFVLGDGALKELSLGKKLMEAAKLAETYEKASPMAKAAIEAGMNASRQAAASTVESKAKGATNAEAVKEGLTTGAITGGSEILGQGLKVLDMPLLNSVKERVAKLAMGNGASEEKVAAIRAASPDLVKSSLAELSDLGKTPSRALYESLKKPAASLALMYAANKFLPESMKLPIEIALASAGFEGFKGIGQVPGELADIAKSPVVPAVANTVINAAAQAAPLVGRAVAAGQVGMNAATSGNNSQPEEQQ